MGWLGDSYLSGGSFLHFSICDCKERILVAGWCTNLVRGTKTAKKRNIVMLESLPELDDKTNV